MFELLIALFASALRPASSKVSACELLTLEEIRAVQGTTVVERKASESEHKSFRFSQCVFATTDVTRSVSLTAITGDANRYWEETFGSRRRASVRKKDPPRRVSSVGKEAFWTGDARAGALYALADELVLRVSVGGVPDEQERISRSAALARAALRRLQKDR